MAKSKRAKGKKAAPKTHMMPSGEKMPGKTHEAAMKKMMKKPPGRMPPADMPMASSPAGMPPVGMPPPPGPAGAGPVPGLPPRRRRVL